MEAALRRSCRVREEQGEGAKGGRRVRKHVCKGDLCGSAKRPDRSASPCFLDLFRHSRALPDAATPSQTPRDTDKVRSYTMPVHETKNGGVVLIAGQSEAKVSHFGAHVCTLLVAPPSLPASDDSIATADSWTIEGEEQLFLSSAVESLNGPAAIRGGIPICFPGPSAASLRSAD